VVEQANGQVYDAPPNLLRMIQGLLPELQGAVRRVAEQVTNDPLGSAGSTMVELAERSGVSAATVTRLCRALGLSGYPELRLGLAADASFRKATWEADVGREIGPDDPVEKVAAVALAAGVQAVQETVSQLNLGVVEQAAEAITHATRVDLYGIGTSSIAAKELQYRLHRIHIASWAWTEVHDGLTSAALLSRGDVALAISHSGRTNEAIEILQLARQQGATTIALTSFWRSPITQVADLVLTTAAQQTTFRTGALAARHSQLTVIDLLYLVVAQRTYERTAKALAVTAQAIAPHRTTPAPLLSARSGHVQINPASRIGPGPESPIQE
jgi:DNA-binding MurR/RpiR family transcriptional regulator